MSESKIFQIERPWGNFRQFTQNETTTVKLINVNPNCSLSLQRHEKRSEFWRVIAGNPIITIDSNVFNATVGDEFTVKKLQAHRIESKDDAVIILEISTGDFDEEDIIRLEDKYGRA